MRKYEKYMIMINNYLEMDNKAVLDLFLDLIVNDVTLSAGAYESLRLKALKVYHLGK